MVFVCLLFFLFYFILLGLCYCFSHSFPFLKTPNHPTTFQKCSQPRGEVRLKDHLKESKCEYVTGEDAQL